MRIWPPPPRRSLTAFAREGTPQLSELGSCSIAAIRADPRTSVRSNPSHRARRQLPRHQTTGDLIVPTDRSDQDELPLLLMPEDMLLSSSNVANVRSIS